MAGQRNRARAAAGMAGLMLTASAIGLAAAQPAEAAYPTNRIIVHVGGWDAGTVEFDIMDSWFPPELFDPDTGEVTMPETFCGLRLKQVEEVHWDDGHGGLIAGEVQGEIPYDDDWYLGGVDFTGPISTCGKDVPWYFPTPLSEGGNGPQNGAQRLIIQLEQPQNYDKRIAFLDHAQQPIDLPNPWDNGGEPSNPGDCDTVPEFCEDEEDQPSEFVPEEFSQPHVCVLHPTWCKPSLPPSDFTLHSPSSTADSAALSWVERVLSPMRWALTLWQGR